MIKCSTFFLLIFIIALQQPGSCQPIPCDDYFYTVTFESIDRPSKLVRIWINPSNGKPETTIIKENIGTTLSALGYNVFDGYMYGLNPKTYEFFRIDVNGDLTNLGIPSNIDTSLDYFCGTMSPNGKTFIALGRTKDTQVDKRVLSINLDRNSAGYLSVIADWETQIEDIAFDPEFSGMIGFDKKTKSLVNVSVGGLVTNHRFAANTQNATLGSLFFDANGDLYAYGGVFYKVDKTNGNIQEIGRASLGNYTDGSSCPYRITFHKTVTPVITLPCTEVMYQYHIRNTAGTAFTQVNIRDTFPDDFIITEVSQPQIGEIASGVGSNILHITQMHLLLGDNDITVKVRVGAQPGRYPTQSSMTAFPFALGATYLSNDPNAGAVATPTVLTIPDTVDVLGSNLLYLCPGGTRKLDVQVGANQYQWNTGDMSQSIDIAEPGIYTVVASTECGDFFDTIQVAFAPEPLMVDLGEDQVIEQGDQLILNVNTNSTELLHFSWQASGDSTLSCMNCSNPIAKPLFSSTYHITITDENGCTATDALSVEVIPVRNIFAPTAFSPNNDGINDVFYLQGKYEAKIIYLRIFDRWGNQVFQLQNGRLNDPEFGWKGHVHQINAQAYLYVAEIEFTDGAKKQLSGEIIAIK